MIKAEMVLDSINEFGNRVTTMAVTLPRKVLAEFNTHRMFSRNSASSRAIPFKKMVEMVKEDPFIPIAWMKDHSGMQGTEYFTDPKDIEREREAWLAARDFSITCASNMSRHGVTKQICNRLLEPYMWHRVLVTATEYENFFELRCPQYEFNSWSTKNIYYYRSRKDLLKNHPDNNIPDNWTLLDWLQINKSGAEIHISLAAEAMWDCMNESTPKLLKAGEWHMPFGDNVDEEELDRTMNKYYEERWELVDKDILGAKLKISTARCARTSYNNFGENVVDYTKDVELHDRLLSSKHMSPFEHCAQAMSEQDLDNYLRIDSGKVTVGVCRNFIGWKQYRAIAELASS